MCVCVNDYCPKCFFFIIGLELDYAKYPTREQQEVFLKHYLIEFHSRGKQCKCERKEKEKIRKICTENLEQR